MKRMRFLVAILIMWLFLFYNIERLSASIDITGIAYIFVPVMAGLTIFVSPLRKAPLWALLVVPIGVFLTLKVIGYRQWGTPLPLTVTEVCIIALTTVLSRRVSEGISEFEQAVAHISIGRISKPTESFSTGQTAMYQELKRARHHRRPLALMAIGIEDDSIQVALDRMVQEAQQAMMKQYVLSGVARELSDILEDYNIIARDNDHFLALLPEMTADQLADFADWLHQVLFERTGVALQIGTASFPEDAMTFDGLVKKAVREMEEEMEDANHRPEYSPQSQRLAVERPYV